MEFLQVFNITLFLFIGFTLVHGGTSGQKHYIVYMGEHSHPNSESVVRANHDILASVSASMDEAKAAAVHHYAKSFRGFSAMLTPEQADQLAEHDSVVSVFESKINRLHTTRSWHFLGLDSVYNGYYPPMDPTSNVIVGVVDSGIWPESKSFIDEGLGPVPEKFKGECVIGENFTKSHCNKKIIGARFYSKGFIKDFGPLELQNKTFFKSARDGDGHGSHTASTIAGSIVPNISFLGMAKGTARGGALGARLAIYKACWFGMCSDADVLSAMDDAIHDGVDILSLSLGPNPPQPIYFEDSVSIGSYHAFRRNVLISASVGNSIFPGTACNVAPWILTVAASTIDREFHSNILLGNSRVLKGFSLNPILMKQFYGLIDGKNAAATGIPSRNASFCKDNTLDPTLIKGKIVVCTIETVADDRPAKAKAIKKGGGVGMVLMDHNAKEVGFEYVIPSTIIGEGAVQELQAYMNTDKKPRARILSTVTVVDVKPAPEVAAFSSVGPNIITPDIIKPDITGPGVNILAAWSPVATEDTTEHRSVDYNIISGTSMACPHITAVAAILKSHQPSWSPAAIMSAIVTTATTMDNRHRLIGRGPNGTQTTPFDYGSGHVNPIEALKTRLVYDFNSHDVLNFLCSSTGASPAQLKNLTGEPIMCQKSSLPASYNLNYPSIGVSNLNGSLSVYRTVTYYGMDPSVYVASVEDLAGVKVKVVPSEIEFRKRGEKVTFRVDFSPYKASNGNFVFGALIWKNEVHSVRSPIALKVVAV